MPNQPNLKAIDNFISTIDLDMDIDIHFRNALRDSFMYGWDSSTLRSIFTGIEDAYFNRKKEKINNTP